MSSLGPAALRDLGEQLTTSLLPSDPAPAEKKCQAVCWIRGWSLNTPDTQQRHGRSSYEPRGTGPGPATAASSQGARGPPHPGHGVPRLTRAGSAALRRHLCSLRLEAEPARISWAVLTMRCSAANTGLPTWLHLTTARAGHGKDSSSEWCTVMSPVCTRGLEKLNDLPRAPTAWKLSPGLPESRSPAPGTKPQLLQSGARVL